MPDPVHALRVVPPAWKAACGSLSPLETPHATRPYGKGCIHGLPKVSPGPAKPNTYMPCGRAGYGRLLPPRIPLPVRACHAPVGLTQCVTDVGYADHFFFRGVGDDDDVKSLGKNAREADDC
jgi:hypothetical protein